MINCLYREIKYNHGSHKENYSNFCGGFIHRTVQILGPVTLGIGVIIEENVILKGNNFIGHHAVIRPGCVMEDHAELRVKAWMASNCWVGSHSVIYNYANLAKGTKIGNYVYFGVRSTTTNANDIVLHRGRSFVPDPVTVEDGARVATHCCISPGVIIGRNSLVGKGSNVTKDVPAGEIWFGNPASKKGFVSPDDIPTAWMDSVVETINRNGQ